MNRGRLTGGHLVRRLPGPILPTRTLKHRWLMHGRLARWHLLHRRSARWHLLHRRLAGHLMHGRLAGHLMHRRLAGHLMHRRLAGPVFPAWSRIGRRLVHRWVRSRWIGAWRIRSRLENRTLVVRRRLTRPLRIGWPLRIPRPRIRLILTRPLRI